MKVLTCHRCGFTAHRIRRANLLQQRCCGQPMRDDPKPKPAFRPQQTREIVPAGRIWS